MSGRIRRAISEEGLAIITTPTTSGQHRGEKEYIGFDLSEAAPEVVDRLLARVFAEINGDVPQRPQRSFGTSGEGRESPMPKTGVQSAGLRGFEDRLRALMGGRGDLRPFVCSGSPLDCEIFIVGFNPATKMSRSFWSFWDTGEGFDSHAWYQAYLAERAAKPLKPGRTRRNAVSNTRRRIEWIARAAAPVSCLETNLYGIPTDQARELPAAEQNASMLDFLVQEVQPKVILLHGAETRRYMEERLGHALEPGEFTTARIGSADAKVLPVSHLSRGWSKTSAIELGQRLREAAIRG